MNWQPIENGLLTSANYKYEVLKNAVTGKYKIVFSGVKNWNKRVKVVRYYATQPQEKNICLTVRSL